MKMFSFLVALAVLTAGQAYAQTATNPDLTSITTNLNYSAWVIPGMIAVAAALAVLYVARGGISVVMGMIKSAR